MQMSFRNTYSASTPSEVQRTPAYALLRILASLILISAFLSPLSSQDLQPLPLSADSLQTPDSTLAAAARPAYEDDYYIQPGDVVEVIILQRAEISGEYTVNPNGTIGLPVTGNIHIEGLTRIEAEDRVSEALSRYYYPVYVLLKIKYYQRNTSFTVLGEVKAPGVYPITNKIDLIHALGLAQGTTEDAALNRISLIRRSEPGQVQRINLNRLMKNGSVPLNLVLEKDDIIYVPKKTVVSFLQPLNRVMPLVQVILVSILTLNQLQLMAMSS